MNNRRVAWGPRARLGLWLGATLLGCTLLAMNLLTSLVNAQANEPRTGLVLTISGAIGPATLDYVRRGIERAEEEAAEVLIVRVDTPGGLMESTRELIKSILAARVPVVTYVAPQGARAASAGTYLLFASHVAAMAPATHLGSATPVQMGGLPGAPSEEPDAPAQRKTPAERKAPAVTGSDADATDGDGDGEDSGADTGDSTPEPRRGGTAMERKMLEDAVSYIRGLAERHGRNADWAEQAVREAVNLGSREALEKNVIDIRAADLDDLVQQLDGRTVVMSDGERTLRTANLVLTQVDPGWRTRVLSVITDPNIAYFLMIIGFYGIIFELSNPGNLFPGVIGVICLVLALFAFQVLSVNYAGLALILLGLAFIVAEAFIPSFGVLGIGGLVAFVVGSIILMDGTNMDISLPAIGGIAAIAAGFMLWTITRLVTLRRRTPVYGVEHLGQEHAEAIDDFAARGGVYVGHVRLAGERWNAVSPMPIAAGRAVRVTHLDGLTLNVTMDTSRAASSGAPSTPQQGA